MGWLHVDNLEDNHWLNKKNLVLQRFLNQLLSCCHGEISLPGLAVQKYV